MASTLIRRPLPALISLVALLLLTGIVWWRVMNRDDGSDDAAASCPTPRPSATTTQTVLPAPASVTVLVLNATTRNGLAATVSTTLSGLGFKTAEPGNDKKAHSSPATITFGPSGRKAAALVKYYFPGATVTATQRTSATVVVSLGSRFTAVASARTVAAALKRDNTTTATAGPSSPAPSSTAASASC